MSNLLNFSQFINESLTESTMLVDKIINNLKDSIQENLAGGYVEIGENRSIKFETHWELETMKISKLGRVEPTINFKSVLVPKIKDNYSEDVARFYLLDLIGIDQIIEGFTISSSIEMDEIEGAEGFEFTESSNDNYFSIEDMNLTDAFSSNDTELAGEELAAWIDKTVDEYAYRLNEQVLHDLEMYMREKEEADDYEEDNTSEKKETWVE